MRYASMLRAIFRWTAALAAAGAVGLASAPGYANTVYSCGFNLNGELGLGNYTMTSTPTMVQLNHVVAIAAGSGHSVFLLEDGSVFACGDNSFGQLGIGTYGSTPTATQALVGDVVAISAGANHTLFLLGSGDVFGCGSNTHGQLGLGSIWGTSEPRRIDGIYGAVAISAGCNHSLVLLADGTVLAFGLNTDGQLGLGSGSPAEVPDPHQVSTLSNVVAISAGGKHSLFMAKYSGYYAAYACGLNDQHQLGLGPSYPQTVVADPTLIPKRLPGCLSSDPMHVLGLAAGFQHSLIICQSTHIAVAGLNCFGQLGLGSTSPYSIPQLIGPSVGSPPTAVVAGLAHSFFVVGGIAYGFGLNAFGQLGWAGAAIQTTPQQVPGLTDVIAVAAGAYHTLFLVAENGNDDSMPESPPADL